MDLGLFTRSNPIRLTCFLRKIELQNVLSAMGSDKPLFD